MKKILVLCMTMLLCCAGLAFAADDTIRIGVYEPMTGQNAFGGQLEVEGIKMANQEVPTVLGKKVEIIVVDNKSDKVEAANSVTRLIEKEKVNAIIGTYASSLAMAGGEVAEKAGIPMVATSATNPLVTQGKKNLFRVCFIDPLQGAAAATYAIKTLGFKNAAVLTDMASDYAVGLSTFFKKSFEKLGGTIVAEGKYQSGDTDFTAQLTAINAKKPDILFIPAYFAEGAIIIKQAREMGATFKIMGGDAMNNPQMVKIGGQSVEGFVQTSFPYDPNMPNMNSVAKKFTDGWRATHKADDEPNMNAALGYDAYMLIIDAIKRANSADPAAISKALAETKGFMGATGVTTLDENHNAQKPVGLIEIKGQKEVYIGEVVPEGM